MISRSAASIAVPVFDALSKARSAQSAEGKKITTGEARTVMRAVNAALKEADAQRGDSGFYGMADALGDKLRKTLRPEEFVNPRDYQRLGAKALEVFERSPNADLVLDGEAQQSS
jgi:hypothetical protein